ncbi:beta-ketoacyl-ACP synthase II [Roseibacillus ishigakijimensis]|uniref:3-oxoacyl-[acyl-carrier-protein] synthase 2 n=1 Tax=Roseibacillus ishigakijimensis TaxID=454146 RepID=A0A934VNT4_9BACT|nr:beta-ketoacyl-ACP synthase II [Roseibacillus ishigakijimensis]MBK1835396.1 beta-ketoacyl-ACP synthase II [Roseibacillus ishigakijimensis]
MTERRVVITGIGGVTPMGNDWASSWEALKAGKSGIAPIESMDVTDYGCKIGGEVRGYDPLPYFNNPKEGRRVDRYAALAMGAAKMAIANSGVDVDKLDPTRVGVMVGSGIGGLATLEKNHEACLKKGPSRVSPFTIPMMISNIGSGLISMEYGFGGPNMSIVTACATANNSVGEAWRMIKFGDADMFVAGGSEASFTPMGLSGFGNMRALSTRNDEPTRASRPFDLGRDGFVMGEGAGVVIIEELEHAKARGATIYAELAGYGVSADAYHLSAPSPDGTGPARAMGMALKHAGLNPEDIIYLNAHGTSTPLGDIAETKAMKIAFGEYAKNGLMVSSTKSMTGHLLGAAGAVELAACVMAVKEGVVPPTINLEDPDPECDLDYVPNEAREVEVTAAMSNGFGFGGHNATLVVKKFV